MDYGILLEHDEDGLRHAAGTRLDDAIDEYRKAQRQLGPRNQLDALESESAPGLLYSEKYADLEKLAARAGKAAHGEASWWPPWPRRQVLQTPTSGHGDRRRRRSSTYTPTTRTNYITICYKS